MSLFKRILNFPRETLARLRDKRRAARFPLGPAFNLEASVNLIGSDSVVRVRQADSGAGCYWGGRVVDLSSTGLNVMLPQAAITVRGEVTLVTLKIDGHSLEVPCEVAHFRVYNSHSRCGLKLHFGDDLAQKAYLQLLETVASGAGLKPARSSGRNPPGTVRETYRADNGTQLTAWRKGKGGAVDSFELLADGYCLRGETARPGVLEVYTKQREAHPAKIAWSAPDYGLSAGQHTELRQFYRWVVLNASREVPTDLRAWLPKFGK